MHQVTPLWLASYITTPAHKLPLTFILLISYLLPLSPLSFTLPLSRVLLLSYLLPYVSSSDTPERIFSLLLQQRETLSHATTTATATAAITSSTTRTDLDCVHLAVAGTLTPHQG